MMTETKWVEIARKRLGCIKPGHRWIKHRMGFVYCERCGIGQAYLEAMKAGR